MVTKNFLLLFIDSLIHRNTVAAISILLAGETAERQTMETASKIRSPAKKDGGK